MQLFYNLLIRLALVILYLLNLLPMAILNKLGNGLGYLGYKLAKSRRQVGIINLSLCFPEMSMLEKQLVIKQHFKALATSVLAYSKMFYATPAQLKKLVVLKNFHYVTEYYQQQPLIILCPHFVSLDLAALRMTMEIAGCSVYSKQKSVYLTELIKNARQRFNAAKGGKIFSRQEGLRNIIKIMRQQKLPLFYLPDQDLGATDSIFVPFFAQASCATITTLPKLAKLTSSRVVAISSYQQGNQYVVEFSPAWQNYPSYDVVADVIHMNKVIESSIIPHLEQYFWLHKRFKTQPDGRHKLYNKA